MKKQVDRNHYNFESYFHKRRWASIWNQLHEILNLNPVSVLELGPGLGLFKQVAGMFGVCVETLDIDYELSPDYVGSVLELPFSENTYEVTCAFQMLEHLPYEDSLVAFAEMCRVSSFRVVISLPDASSGWSQSITIPKLGVFNFFIPRPRVNYPVHKFDGDHYCEINKRGYSLDKVLADLTAISRDFGFVLVKNYRVPENPYHRFFVFNNQ